MNNAIDRAIAKAKKLKCNYIAYQPLHPDDLIEVLKAMKEPTKEPSDTISIKRDVAEIFIEHYRPRSSGSQCYSTVISNMSDAIEKALKEQK